MIPLASLNHARWIFSEFLKNYTPPCRFKAATTARGLNSWRVPWVFDVFCGFWSSGSMVAAFKATDSSVEAEAKAE